jgi:hypothetical protein
MSEIDNIKRILESIKGENDGEHLDMMIPGYCSHKIIGYQGIIHDLLICKDYIEKLINEKYDRIISSSLLYAFIALYGRCFTDASSVSSPKLESGDFSKDHEHLKVIHHEIMNMRHNFVSHRGETEHETSVAYIKLNITDLSTQVKVKQIKRYFPSSKKLTSYLELINHLITQTELKFKKAGEKVWKHIRTEYPPENFAQLKIAGPTTKNC